MIGIGSLDYGGRDIPRSAICKLKTQESWRRRLVWFQKPENQEHSVPGQKRDVPAQKESKRPLPLS